MNEQKRWLVERRQDVFDDVGANYLEIKDGCLVFSAGDGSWHSEIAIIYAPGQWITVVPEEGP